MSWKDISRKDMREDCWEHFSIECRKSKTDVITTANQKKGKYPEEPMRNQRKNSHRLKRGKRRRSIRDFRKFYIWLV